MKYLLFGTGEYYKRYKKWFEKEDVVALLDNSMEKQGTRIDGISVLPPEEGVKCAYDAIVILSFYVKEMSAQLEKLGVPMKKVYHFFELYWLLDRKNIKKAVRFYGNTKAETGSDTLHENVLLLSLDLEFGGPALALFHAAKILKEEGYQVAVASMEDGVLKDRLLEKNIPVIIDANLQINTMQDVGWIKGFRLIICNTMHFFLFLSKRDHDIPVIWWLHDSGFFYQGIRKDVLRAIDRKNMVVCSVGPVPRQAICQFIPDLPVQPLIYGVTDTADVYEEKQKKCCKLWQENAIIDTADVYEEKQKKGQMQKVCFVSIGYIEQRKGQDILIRAIQLLPHDIREKAEFYFVGQNTSVLAGMLMKQAEQMPQVIFTGTVDRDGINGILHGADMLICPSREDPMPTVCAEAMMHSVPCLVSDATGIAGYIEEGVNGLIFPSENVDVLAEKIKWCIDHKDRLRDMGISARNIYEQSFSERVFERELIKLVKEVIIS